MINYTFPENLNSVAIEDSLMVNKILVMKIFIDLSICSLEYLKFVKNVL